MHVEYSSNNSGGSWWLSDNDWLTLENAGWKVRWIKDEEYHKGEDRYLGALATSAERHGVSLRVAIAEWEDATGESSNALGCSCCGAPHGFTLYDDDGKYVDSYYPSQPSYGDPYED